MTNDDRPKGLGLMARAFIATVVPPGLRAAFEGDLIEERTLRAAAGDKGSLWLWSQLLRSTPSLLWRQLRAAQPGRGIAVRVTAGTLAISTAYLGFEGAFALPWFAWSSALAGIAIACSGLFVATAPLRLLPLALGTLVTVVGSAMGGDNSSGMFFTLFVIPVFAYPSLDIAMARAEGDSQGTRATCR